MLITYSGTVSDSSSTDRIAYGVQDELTIGIASDSPIYEASAIDDLEVKASMVEGKSYIFVTKPDANVEEREEYLEEFDDLILPSFGYSITTNYFIKTILDYKNLVLLGNITLLPGIHSLFIKNVGSDENNTFIEANIR